LAVVYIWLHHDTVDIDISMHALSQ